jgi:F420-non-reducing hydrogenase iron-sulfur subunit
MSAPSKVEWIGIICERSVDFDAKLDDEGRLVDDPSVKIIKVPCSGLIQPIMLEAALNKGAKGVVAGGCRIGDCHYREGNKFLRERLQGKRMPKLKATVDKRRIQAFWLSAIEYDKFKDLLEAFQASVGDFDGCAAKQPVTA